MHLLLSCWWTIGSQIRGSRSRKGQKTNIYIYERISVGSALCRGCKCWMRTNICFAIRQISLRTRYFTPDFIEADFPPHFSKLDWCVPISVHDSLNFQHCRQRKCGFFFYKLGRKEDGKLDICLCKASINQRHCWYANSGITCTSIWWAIRVTLDHTLLLHVFLLLINLD